MPVEYTLLKDAPCNLTTCPQCGEPFVPFLRGIVQRSPWRWWWPFGSPRPYCCLICEACKQIVGHEMPPSRSRVWDAELDDPRDSESPKSVAHPAIDPAPEYVIEHRYQDSGWDLLKYERFDDLTVATDTARELSRDAIFVGMTRVVNTVTGEILVTFPAGGPYERE